MSILGPISKCKNLFFTTDARLAFFSSLLMKNIDLFRVVDRKKFFLPGLDGCIKRFKLGHRDVKIQSASEPLALRRVSLNECQNAETLDPCSHEPCFNGGTCLANHDSTRESPYVCRCNSGFNGDRCDHSDIHYSNDISALPMSAFVPAFTNGKRLLKNTRVVSRVLAEITFSEPK